MTVESIIMLVGQLGAVGYAVWKIGGFTEGVRKDLESIKNDLQRILRYEYDVRSIAGIRERVDRLERDMNAMLSALAKARTRKEHGVEEDGN